ncbi:SUMF1/EgtB/PvdO family nonheme iron enzyme [Nitrospira sp. Kam-Ns4a]
MIIGAVALWVVAATASADHDVPARDPWAPPIDVERLAAMEAPEGMVAIPAGWFLMGSDPRQDPDAGPQEQPQRQVYLERFDIDRYEVSNVHYLRSVRPVALPGRLTGREIPFRSGWPGTQ